MHWRQKCLRLDRHVTRPQAKWGLPRQNAIRGARARCPATDRPRNGVTSYHSGYLLVPCWVTSLQGNHMNTTMTNNTVPGQPLAHYDPEVAQLVQGWLASGQLLA